MREVFLFYSDGVFKNALLKVSASKKRKICTDKKTSENKMNSLKTFNIINDIITLILKEYIAYQRERRNYIASFHGYFYSFLRPVLKQELYFTVIFVASGKMDERSHCPALAWQLSIMHTAQAHNQSTKATCVSE